MWKFNPKQLLMEFMGVFFLCYCGGSSVMRLSKQGGLPVGPMALINVALAHGLPLALLIAFGGPISGAQYNPGVSLGLLFSGQQGLVQTILYILAQLIGSLVAGVSLYLLKPSSFKSNYLGYPTLAPDVSIGQGFAYETIASFLLGLAVYYGVRRGETAKTIGIWVGSALMSMINSIGPMTGASLNFARNFGPEIASNGTLFNDRGGWLYYVATLLGPILAAWLVKYFLNKDFGGCGGNSNEQVPAIAAKEVELKADEPQITTERNLKTELSESQISRRVTAPVVGAGGYPPRSYVVGAPRHISPGRVNLSGLHHSGLHHSGIHHSGIVTHHSPIRRIG
jgi:glycerol uptake facilitator-like aquaporin